MSNRRQEAAIKAKEKRLAKNPNYYKEISRKGGLASTYRPMKDPEYARKLVNLRWERYRANKAAESAEA